MKTSLAIVLAAAALMVGATVNPRYCRLLE